jgi:hypothetical protein
MGAKDSKPSCITYEDAVKRGIKKENSNIFISLAAGALIAGAPHLT